MCALLWTLLPPLNRFDVAVVRLNRRVDMAPHISPICLPPKDMSMQSLHGWAAGWGALQPGSRLRPKTLQVSFVLVQTRVDSFNVQGLPKVWAPGLVNVASGVAYHPCLALLAEFTQPEAPPFRRALYIQC